MKKKQIITWVFAISFVVCTVPARAQSNAIKANPMALAGYNERIAQKGSSSNATAIGNAVLNDKNSNPAQAAYNERVKQAGKTKDGKNFSAAEKNNEADQIYQAVLNAQKKMVADANAITAKYNTPAVIDALNKIDSTLGRIPHQSAKEAQKVVQALGIATSLRELNQLKARGASDYQLAYKTLDIIGKIGSIGVGPISNGLVSLAIDGAKGIIAADKKRHENISLIPLDGSGYHPIEEYGFNGSEAKSKYRDIVISLKASGVSNDDIIATVNALKLIEGIK